MKGLFLFSIFVIIYGSLFPFDFQYVDWRTEGLQELFSRSIADGSVPDMISNIILFLPFGFAGTELISRNNKSRIYYFLLYLFGVTLALGLQFLQIYLEYRVPALYDALWNYVGIFLGGVLARFMDKQYPNILAAEDRLALLALVLSWIVFLLAPFVFTFDYSLLQENIDAYLDPDEYRAANVVFYIGIWITFKKLIDEIRQGKASLIFSLELIIPMTLFAKIFVYRDLFEPELLPGGIIAVILLRSGIFKRISPYKIAALLMVPTWYYNSLYPLEFITNPFKQFNWIPFSELFSGDILAVIRNVFYKTFAYGSIIFTLYRSLPNSNWVTYFCVIYAGSIEYFQHMTFTRVGGLTEPLLAIFLCTFIHQKRREKFNLYENKEA